MGEIITGVIPEKPVFASFENLSNISPASVHCARTQLVNASCECHLFSAIATVVSIKLSITYIYFFYIPTLDVWEILVTPVMFFGMVFFPPSLLGCIDHYIFQALLAHQSAASLLLPDIFMDCCHCFDVSKYKV